MANNRRYSSVQDDFLEEYEEDVPKRFSFGKRSSSEPEFDEAGRRVNPYRKRSDSGKDRAAQRRSLRTRSDRKPVDWNRVWNRAHFYFCAVLVMAGCMMVLMQYMAVFNKNNEISRLRSQLSSAEDSNALLAAAATGETMNMDTLYSFATNSLGMIEADSTNIIYITVTNQSYTTSSLPTTPISDSKVTFHWFN